MAAFYRRLPKAPPATVHDPLTEWLTIGNDRRSERGGIRTAN
jgi:hypothetical protein